MISIIDGLVHLQVGGHVHQFHPLLLRDACTCPECRRPATNERLLNSGGIDPSIVVTSAELLGDDAIGFEFSDGHRTCHELSWLVGHDMSIDLAQSPAGDSMLWRSGSERGITVQPWASLIHDDHALANWIDAWSERGVALVSDTPIDDDPSGSLQMLAMRLGPIQPTNYDDIWTIDATVDPVSEVESQHALAVHTDLPYRDLAPGAQLLLCVHADVAGGASTLVDGYAVAETIRDADPTAWHLLTSVDLTYPYVRDTVEHHGRAPLIGLRTDGRYHQIRRAPDLVGVPLVLPEQTKAFYRALALWNALVDDPAFEIQLRIEPGQVLAFNNHRVLHGRTAFDLAGSPDSPNTHSASTPSPKKRRFLMGCYLDPVDIRSTRRVLARASVNGTR